METVTDFILGGSKITADGDCGHEIKRRLLLRLWCWEGLGAGGEGDDRGWDRWMASLTQWTPGVGDGQGGLACCDSWSRKESDMTERLNWTDWLLRRNVMNNLDSSLKSTDILLPTKVHLVKAVIFPVVMYGCEHWRIDAFELWCWRRLLRVPWTASRSSSSS